MRVILCLSLAVAVVLGDSTRDYNCDSMMPVFPGSMEGQGPAPLKTVSITPQQEAYLHGSKLTSKKINIKYDMI